MAKGKEKKPWVATPKRQAVLLYGQRMRGLGNVSLLIKHLRELGMPMNARGVELAVRNLQVAAKKEYEQRRAELDSKVE